MASSGRGPERAPLSEPIRLLTSLEASVGTIGGLPAERVITVVRRDAEVNAVRSVFFMSDRVAVRATCRVGFGFRTPPLWSASG